MFQLNILLQLGFKVVKTRYCRYRRYFWNFSLHWPEYEKFEIEIWTRSAGFLNSWVLTVFTVAIINSNHVVPNGAPNLAKLCPMVDFFRAFLAHFLVITNQFQLFKSYDMIWLRSGPPQSSRHAYACRINDCGDIFTHTSVIWRRSPYVLLHLTAATCSSSSIS